MAFAWYNLAGLRDGCASKIAYLALARRSQCTAVERRGRRRNDTTPLTVVADKTRRYSAGTA